MAILSNRVKTTNNFLELSKFVFFSFRKFLVIGFIFACSWLLYFPIQTISTISLEVSGSFISFGSVISDAIINNTVWIYDRLSYFKNLEEENIRLKLQLANLSKTELLVSSLNSENQELRKLLKVTDDLKFNKITARLIGVSTTPFNSSGIVQAGSVDKVSVNDLITNHDGLIGRVVNVSKNYSAIILVSDPNSRIPVIVSSKDKCILAKQGDDMKLIYLHEDNNVKLNDLIYTSGDGKVYPYGLLVGKVYKINSDGVFVKLSANVNNTEFVNIESQNSFIEENAS